MGFWDREKKKIVNEEVEAEEVEEEEDEEEDDEVDCYIYVFCDGESESDCLTWEFDSIKERDKIFSKLKDGIKEDGGIANKFIEYGGDLVLVSKIKYILARDD